MVSIKEKLDDEVAIGLVVMLPDDELVSVIVMEDNVAETEVPTVSLSDSLL